MLETLVLGENAREHGGVFRRIMREAYDLGQADENGHMRAALSQSNAWRRMPL